jgi:PAS domain S-box-containing protein
MDRRLHDIRNDLAVATGTLHAFVDGKFAPTPDRLAIVLEHLESLDRALVSEPPAPVTAKEHLLAAVIEGSPYAKILVNERGAIVLVNAQAEELFGYTRDELLGGTIEMLVPERFRSGHPELRSHFSDSPSARPMGAGRDLYGRRKDASEMPIEIGLNPIVIGNDPYTLAAVTDITERKRSEELRLVHAGVQQHAAELEILNRELERASRFKTEFVSTMSHELRTPLSAIIGAAELLATAPLDARSRLVVQTITEASTALFALINSVLDFSKIEAGKMELISDAFDVEAIIDGAAGVASHLAHQKGITLHAFSDPDLPAVMGDRGRIRQILLNLLGNAVKFTESGSVIVRADLVAADAKSVTIRFEVEDTGIGIAEDIVPRLFEPFAQADRSPSRRFGGTGLGLSISKRLVALMGGSIGVRSAEGSGSTFWFVLQFDRAGERSGRPRVSERIGTLIVSGDDTFVRIVERYLRSWGMTSRRSGGPDVPGASTGAESALVLIVDADCPGPDALTGPLLAFDRARTITIGNDAPLGKPIRQSQLFEAIVAAAGASMPDGTAARALAPPSAPGILVAEDNAQLQQLLQLQFDELGVDVTFVCDGRQALAAMRGRPFALIFMDCQMPNLDGLDATSRIRRDEARSGSHVPIVAMTANAFAEDREACLRAGMDDYLAKPIRLADLRTMIERWAKPAR